MTKKTINKYFISHKNLIEKIVWKYYKKYYIDFDDLEAQAYLIFCEAIKTFDKGLGYQFSTYLTNELGKLSGYCNQQFVRLNKDIVRSKSNKRGYGRNYYVNRLEITEALMYDYRTFEKVLNKIEYEMILSNDAKEVIKFLCDRDWEDTDYTWIPRYSAITETFLSYGWKRSRINKVLDEIKAWWNSSNKDQFCLEV